MSDVKFPELFPIAFGNEEETMMMAGPVGANTSEFRPALGFLGTFVEFLPDGIKTVRDGIKQHNQAGGMMYRTGAGDSTLFERTTPECSTPTEMATAIQASESLLVTMVGNYVRSRAKVADVCDETPAMEVRIQRRVVDGAGNHAASHDNYEARRIDWLKGFDKKENGAARVSMLSHLATRSFMTGAGYVNDNGVYFAQKVQSIKYLAKYGFLNSSHRTVMQDDTGARFEGRCNDINISPWAIRSRVGGGALVFTALQTPLMAAIHGRTPPIMKGSSTAKIEAFKAYNVANLDADGSLKAGHLTHEAVDFQEWQFELIGKHLGKYVDLSDEYRDIVEGNIQYCHDFRRVLDGEADLSLLRDRSDNAAKFSKIIGSVERGRDMGFDRTATDIISQLWDLRYDAIRVSPGLGGQPRVEYGYGYKWRDAGGFVGQLPAKDVERAVYYPPTTTRAHVRGNLIRQGKIAGAQWSTIDVRSGAEGLEEYGYSRVRLPQVVLSSDEQQLTPEKYVQKVASVKKPLDILPGDA